MPSETYKKIANYRAVTDLYGEWLSFEDAELVELSFVRGNTLEVMESNDWEARVPASSTATFLVFDARFSKGTAESKEALVQLRFEDLLGVKIEGFNYQNPMLNLVVSEEYSESLKREILIFRWGQAALSCNAEIKCINAKVVAVTRPNKSSQPTPYRGG